MDGKLRRGFEDIFGSEIYHILEYMLKKGEVTNEELSRKFKIDQNELRRILYKLEEYNIVSSKRVPNGMPLGFTYVWKVNIDSTNTLRKKLIKKQLEYLIKRYENMSDYIFVCPYCNLKFDFEEAMEYEFKCPEDGEILMQIENEEKKKIFEKICKLKKELENI